jgi:hypothetical protein
MGQSVRGVGTRAHKLAYVSWASGQKVAFFLEHECQCPSDIACLLSGYCICLPGDASHVQGDVALSGLISPVQEAGQRQGAVARLVPGRGAGIAQRNEAVRT